MAGEKTSGRQFEQFYGEFRPGQDGQSSALSISVSQTLVPLTGFQPFSGQKRRISIRKEKQMPL